MKIYIIQNVDDSKYISYKVGLREGGLDINTPDTKSRPDVYIQ